MPTTKPTVIAVEEHYADRELTKYFGYPARQGPQTKRLEDLGELRLKDMDEAGIDMQVISHGAPATQQLYKDIAAEVTRGVNDRLHRFVQANPARFAAFAALPTPDPKAAAEELERTARLGFKGAMVHGLTHGRFLDEKEFWPIFERAQALDVPIYIHPAVPSPAVTAAYYKDYAERFPFILTAGWGFTVETATQAVRLVLSGVFDAYPKLKIIVGHLGEGIPYLLWRMDHAFSRAGNQPLSFRKVFCDHFHITTSGNFSNPALLCAVQEIGIDRILFAVDWPFVTNPEGTEWMKTVPLCEEDRVKVLSGNAKRLLKM